MSPSSDKLASLPLSFEPVALLAMGALARVELCRVTHGERAGELAAVKRLAASMAEEPEQLAMFQDEIWMTSLLDHSNITKLYGWGEDDDGHYLATEFVRGVSLARLLRTVTRTGEAFTERLVVHIAAEICAGLEHAHALRSNDGEYLNLVHRDLTPGNILLSFEGDVKISDFGLAKAKQRVTSTAIGMTKGDPAYMSPEQVTAKTLDGRSDVFTLGILLFELFAQRKPWVVSGVVDALDKIVNTPSPKLGEVCPKLDPALAAIVDRCLAKDPDARFASAAELHRRFAEWLTLHGYDENRETLGRFVRRNAMRQMRWLDRALAGDLIVDEVGPTPLELSSEEPVNLERPPPARESKSGPTDPTRASIRQPAEPAPASAATLPTRTSTPRAYVAPPEPPPMVASPPSEASRPIDLARGAPSPGHAPAPGSTHPPSSGSVADNATTMRRRRVDSQPPHTRRRDEAPPFGAMNHSPAAVAASTSANPRGDEPSTLRRSPLVGEIHDIVARLRRDADRYIAEGQLAAHEARLAAERSESASRAAHVAAAAAEQAAEALRRATQALDLAARGDVAGAVSEAHQAQAIVARIAGKSR